MIRSGKLSCVLFNCRLIPRHTRRPDRMLANVCMWSPASRGLPIFKTWGVQLPNAEQQPQLVSEDGHVMTLRTICLPFYGTYRDFIFNKRNDVCLVICGVLYRPKARTDCEHIMTTFRNFLFNLTK